MPEVLGIESAARFSPEEGRPWGEEDFLRRLRQQNCIGMVAEQGERVVGFMVYELQKRRLDVLTVGVHPGHRRRGVGSALVRKLKGKLSAHRRTGLRFDIHEADLASQLFLRANGLEATRVLRGHFGPDDAYRMEFKLKGAHDVDGE